MSSMLLLAKIMRRAVFLCLPVFRAAFQTMDSRSKLEFIRAMDRILEQQVKFLGDYLYQLNKARVVSGPFRGMIISRESSWSDVDLASRILGLYENQVMETLSTISDFMKSKQGKPPILVNLGGGDGYFAIGSVVANISRRTFVFERSASGREKIAQNSQLNGIDGKIHILEEANPAMLDTLSLIPEFDLASTFFLVDIEGYEYELLNRELLCKISGNPIIVELHPGSDGEYSEIVAKTRALFSEFYDVSDLYFRPNLDLFTPKNDLLSGLNDINFVLGAAEGRPMAMIWLLCIPRNWHEISKS